LSIPRIFVGIGAGLEPLEELSCRHLVSPTRWPAATVAEAARLDEGSREPSATASSGIAAATQSAVRRLTGRRWRRSATAPTPPRPIENPIESPDAIPIRRGRYSWAMTCVTPNVPITHAPTSARQIAPTAPPATMKRADQRRRGHEAPHQHGPAAEAVGSRACKRRCRERRPASISASRWFPWLFEWPSDTSQSGTKGDQAEPREGAER